jgi:uncharacterized membrane protein (DUF4010 family)
MQYELIFEILLSIAIGALIGIERQRRARGEVFAGIRTFMLVSLFGYLSAFLTSYSESLIPIYIGLVGVCLLSGLSYFLTYKKVKAVGLTTEVAFILTFLIGILIFFDTFPYLLPISLGTIVTLILFGKEASHKFARHLTKKELRDAIIFVIIAFIILPLLPTEPIDPYGIFDLYLIWFALVLLLGISFVAYVALKVFGARGLLLSGFFGGLASSTSVTAAMAGRIKDKPSLTHAATSATVLACSAMFLRSLLIISIFNLNAAFSLLVPFLCLGLSGFFISYLMWRKTKIGRRETVKVTSPLSFKLAIKFTLLFALILAVTRTVRMFYGTELIYPISFISGLSDVDAIAISLATLEIESKIISKSIILAGMANTIFKMLLFSYIGGKRANKEIFKIFPPQLAIGLLFFLLI